MKIKSAVGTFVTVLLVIIAILVVGTQLLGFASPVGYVETDSMEPQLTPGDGYVGIPRALAGDLSSNDVVTYDAQSLNDGGLVTHRIVEQTDAGYITKGDNNPFTDQSGPEPPVAAAQIELVVVQINGEILAIPYLGDLAVGAQSIISTAISTLGLSSFSADNPGIVVTVIGLVFLTAAGVYDLFSADATRSLNRSTRRNVTFDSRLILLAILLILSLPLLSVTALPSDTQELAILSADRASPDDSSIIKAGTSTEINSTVTNDQLFPMVVILEPATEGVEFSEQVLTAAPGETVTTRLRLYAPPETGAYTRARSKTFYIRLLPPQLIADLHRLHPVVARLTTMSVLFAPVIVIYWVVVGFRSITLRDTQQ